MLSGSGYLGDMFAHEMRVSGKTRRVSYKRVSSEATTSTAQR